jgi:hypothetical protein
MPRKPVAREEPAELLICISCEDYKYCPVTPAHRWRCSTCGYQRVTSEAFAELQKEYEEEMNMGDEHD